jgi:hypothetical protein
MLRNTSLVLAAAVAALAGGAAFDSASAGLADGGIFGGRCGFCSYSAYRASPGATSRPSNRNMRIAPSTGGRGMMRGGSRMGGGMRGLR